MGLAFRRLQATLPVLGILLLGAPAAAHSIDAVTLRLTEVADGTFAIDWQTIAGTIKGMREPAQYPPACAQRGALLDCGPHGLVGAIEFPWLAGSASRVTVVIDWKSGSRLLRIVDGRSPRLSVYGFPPSAGLRFLKPIALDYTRLGIEHILTGFDHLMFVLAITILVRNRRSLFLAITAFTVAHSLTLAATVFGWVRLPSAAVETTTVSPAFGRQTSRRPKYAVKPFSPSTPNESERGRSSSRTFRMTCCGLTAA